MTGEVMSIDAHVGDLGQQCIESPPELAVVISTLLASSVLGTNGAAALENPLSSFAFLGP